MEKISLIVEKSEGLLWGRVDYNENLIVDSAETLDELKRKISVLLADFEGVENVTFEVSYDLTTFFEMFNFLKISKIANVAGVNPSLLRHYAAASKTASKDQLEKIEKAVNHIGQEMMTLKLA